MNNRNSKLGFTPLEADYFNNRRNKSFGLLTGFTLIELMAVISIITLFSSIVLVALNNVRDNARIAGSKQFSSHVVGQLGDNLISYWTFDEGSGTTARDSWGTNNGTVNGATWTSSGVIRGALSFDGSNQYVSLPAVSGSLNININPVTLEAWIKPNSVAGSSKEIVGRGTAASNGYGINLNGNKINLGLHGGGNFNSAAVLTTGNWYHIVGVIKGANSKIYINGVADINTGTINVVNSALNGSIGASSVGVTYFFNGIIDEVRIYNAALTAQEIQQRYAESASRHGLAGE